MNELKFKPIKWREANNYLYNMKLVSAFELVKEEFPDVETLNIESNYEYDDEGYSYFVHEANVKNKDGSSVTITWDDRDDILSDLNSMKLDSDEISININDLQDYKKYTLFIQSFE